MKRDRITKRRHTLARMAERAAVPERPIRGRGPLYLIRPAVSVACAPSLRAIAAAFRDDTRHIDEESVDARKGAAEAARTQRPAEYFSAILRAPAVRCSFTRRLTAP